MLSADDPEWEPLLNFAPDHVGDFMWMYAVVLTDGTRLQAYKHYWTRDYLHLDDEGRAFICAGKEFYEVQFIDEYRRPNGSDATQHVLFFGNDLEGVALEVLAAETEEEEFTVIHAMNLRGKFSGLYEEARQWQK